MQRDAKLYLQDIQISCEKILKYTQGLSFDQFCQDELVYDAVIRNLIIIGEAAKNIPESSKNRFENIEWKKLCGLRNVIAHAYFGIDNLIVWNIIQTKIPELLHALQNPK